MQQLRTDVTKKKLVFCLGLLFITISCSRESPVAPSANTDSAAQVASSTTRVLQASTKDNASQWILVNPIEGAITPLTQASDDTELLALDDVAGEFYYRDANQIVKGSWRVLQRAAERISAMPPTPYAVWIDRDESGLRALEMREPTPNEARRMSAEPPDARPMWAVLWKLARATWVELDKRTTSWGADGSRKDNLM